MYFSFTKSEGVSWQRFIDQIVKPPVKLIFDLHISYAPEQSSKYMARTNKILMID